MNNYEWKSPLAKKMQEFLTIKRMAGFKYESQERVLKKFDEYCFAHGYTYGYLSQEAAEGFCYGIHYEKNSTRYLKEKTLRDFAKYMCDYGNEAYVCPVKSAPKKSNFVPYIYTEEELSCFFQAIDQYPLNPRSNRNIVDPLMFRMLYGCGLRLSEVLNLKISNVNLEEGTLTILHAKNNKDRIIPMSNSLKKRCIKYKKQMHAYHDDEFHFFPNQFGKKFNKDSVYPRFREYLWNARIHHSGKGPRIHDLRHTYCVHRLKRWVLSGKELMNLLPYLSVYMGHSDFRGTQYYLRLTADLYPDIIKKSEAALAHIFPKGGAYEKK